MLKPIFIALLSFLLPFSSGPLGLITGSGQKSASSDTGILEKMIVANGSVSMDLDLNRLNGTRSAKESGEMLFDVERNTFFTIIVFNDELRGPLPSSIPLTPQSFGGPSLPAKLNASYRQLVIENMPFGEQYEFAVRDAKTGFVFFNIEGHQYEYQPEGRQLSINDGRMLISKQFANSLGRSSEAGEVVGTISITATMRPIEVSEIVNGEMESNSLPPSGDPLDGTVPGPDVIVGDVYGLAQFGSSNGTQVGLSLGTNSCNFGTENLNWFALPSNDHPVIPQNMYRMSGGANNQERFEQIGQSAVKHAFTALTQNLCNLGCNGVGGSRLGSGCSDPYSASLNSGPNLGSRAWINPFTGVFPRGDSGTDPNSHSGHNHTGPIHRIITEINDLNTNMNQGAKYFAEGQYVTPHEYAWCQTHPGECNMYNNASYREYTVSGTTSFSFSPAAETQRTKPAISAWPGATMVDFEPAPGTDGRGTIAYKVTNPSAGVWHYEYAVYNQNIDRAIQSFSIPLGSGITLSNVGFHSPPQHPGFANDGTMGNAGFSNSAWTQTQTTGSMAWSAETITQNPNANAIRWGTMYNFRFDSNRPPQNVNATIGFLKTGSPINVQVQGPMPQIVQSAVFVSGRVLQGNGYGLYKAHVNITDGSGTTRTVATNHFGYYRFDGILTGVSYTVSVSAKGYNYPSQMITPSDNITGLNFTAP